MVMNVSNFGGKDQLSLDCKVAIFLGSLTLKLCFQTKQDQGHNSLVENKSNSVFIFCLGINLFKRYFMKTEILTADLKACLKRVNLVASSKGSNNVTHNVLINVEGTGRTSFSGINYDDRSEYYLEWLVTQDSIKGSVLVNCSKLSKIAAKLESETVILELTKEYLSVISGNLTTKVPTFNYDLFPDMLWSEVDILFKISAKDFKEVYDRCFFAIGKNESRKNLMGLNIAYNKAGNVVFTAASGFVIAKQEKQIKHLSDSKINIIFPGTTFKKAVKIFDSEDLSFSFNDNHVVISDGLRTLQVNTIEADYPVLHKLTEVFVCPHKVNSIELFTALDMLYVMTDKCNSVAKTTVDGSFKLETKSVEQGKSCVELPVSSSHESVVGLNINFMFEITKIFKKTTQTNIFINGNRNPVVFTSDDTSGYKAALMPVLIDW